MRKGNILPIAVMAFAIVGFLFLVSWAVIPGLKWPWSINTSVRNTIVNTNVQVINGIITPDTNFVVCAQDAKQCPDGSYVSRTGPDCAFATCPSNTSVNASGPSNRNTNTNRNVNTSVNTNLAVSIVLQVQFVDIQTRQPIADTTVQLYTDNGVRCATTPCPTNGRTWLGKTDNNGRIAAPADVVDESMTFTLNGYQAKELHTGGTQQSDGSWILPLTFGVTGTN